MITITLGLLLHARHALGQALQPCGHFMFALVTLLLMLVHRAQQPLKMTLQHLLEVIEVSRFLDTALQAIHLLTDLRIHLARGAAAVGVPVAGRLQIALEGLQPLVETLEVGLRIHAGRYR